MLASIHVADLGPRRTLPLIAKSPSRISAPGLRNANLALAARLGGPLPTKTDIGRIALLAMWDDDAALDHFLAVAPLAHTLAGGWYVRLEPLRAHGSWPGLPDDVSQATASRRRRPGRRLHDGKGEDPTPARLLEVQRQGGGRASSARPDSSGRPLWCGRRSSRPVLCGSRPTRALRTHTRRATRTTTRSPPAEPSRSTTKRRSCASGLTRRSATSTARTRSPTTG